MKLAVATNDEKRSAHLQRIVTQIRNDKRRGDAYLPQLMVDKLHGLHRVFRKQMTDLGKANGRKMSAVKARNETTRELCFLVRDVYVMAKRKYERGKIDDHVLATHVIPKEPVRDNERMTASWVSRAELILDGDLTHSTSHPTILRDPTRTELQTAMTLADRAHQEAIDAVDHLGQMQTRMQTLRKELDQLLLKARHALVGAFFFLSGPDLRECLHAYGYHYKGKRRKKAEPQTRQDLPAEPTPTEAPKTKQPVPQEPAPPTPGAEETPPEPPTAKLPEPPEPKVSLDKLPKDFLDAITVEDKPSPPTKKPPNPKASIRKQPSSKEKEKKKSRRKQARQSRKQNR